LWVRKAAGWLSLEPAVTKTPSDLRTTVPLVADPDRPSRVTDVPWLYVWRPDGFDDVDLDRTGKWMIFASRSSIDKLWYKLSNAVRAGELGPSAKVATAMPAMAEARSHAVMIYTADWADQHDVRRVLAALRRLGITARLSYKTDAATLAGTYGKGSAIYVSQPDSLDFEDRRQS
jgi:hypothetical protein